MKRILNIIIVATMLAACKKTQVNPGPLASVNITNAVIGGDDLIINNSAQTVYANSYGQFSINTGSSSLKLYSASAPGNPYYNKPLPASPGDGYSLFLTGSSPLAVESVLIKENYSNYRDSLCGVRFINLSPGSSPISVNISGQANGSEVSSLAYKAYTTFKQYAAKKVNTSYTFQVRNAVSGTLITSYRLSTPYFNNVTIALTGTGTMLIKNY